jgi:hypothetical protein
MQPPEQQSLATLQQQIHDGIERVRQTITDAKGVLLQCNENLDAVSRELICIPGPEEEVA